MNVNERDEISASVAAHAELGPQYAGAVAEGLVERIGEEIDKRIDARFGGQGQLAPPRPNRAAGNGGYGPPAYRGPAAPTPSMPAAVPPPPPAPRRVGGLSGMVLGLGSLGLGVGATSVVVAHHVESVAALLMVALIWAAITVVNVAHSQRKL